MTFREPIGVYAQLSTRRAQHTALVANMSPGARHVLFPEKYAKPVPYEQKPTNAELQELKRLRTESTKLKARIASLEARIEMLLEASAPAAADEKIRISDPFPTAAVDLIIGVIGKHWAVSPASLRSNSRERRFVRPRQAAFKMLGDVLSLSQNAIGRFFKRDHTTVMHGLRKTAKLVATDELWLQRYEAAKAEIAEALK